MYDEKYVAFSPSGRYACRLGQTFESEWIGDKLNTTYPFSMHLIDFEEESYYDINLVEQNSRVLKFYWLDDEHIGVIQYHHHEKSYYKIKRILYKLDRDAHRMHVIEIHERQHVNHDYLGCNFDVSDGFLTINGKEYLVWTEEMPRCGVWNYIDYPRSSLRFIARQFAKNFEDIDHKIAISNREIGAAVEFVKNIPLEKKVVSLTAHNNHLYIVLPGLQILAMDINKYFKILHDTSIPPSYLDYCSKIELPTSGLRPYQTFIQNKFLFLMMAHDKEYFIRIYDLNTEQLTSVNKIDGLLDSDLEMHSPNLFVHPSGQVVQFQINNYVGVGEKINGRMTFSAVNREENLIKFVDQTPVEDDEGKSNNLASEENLLSRARDSLKLPRCLKEGRNLLILPTVNSNDL